MDLKKEVENFNLNKSSVIDQEDKDGKMSEAFRQIAEIILSGHFLVKKNNSNSYVIVHPVCIEIYYHEEGEGTDKVKDYIVYHRNSDDGKQEKDVFPFGILHNHVSGIDLTFEQKREDKNHVRFSALIREFWIDSKNKYDEDEKGGKYEIKEIVGSSESSSEKRPTRLYDALYSQFSVFDGFSIQWVDGTDEEKKEIKYIGTRINVPQYRFNDKHKLEKLSKEEDDKLNTLNKKYKQCSRMWRYSINKN